MSKWRFVAIFTMVALSACAKEDKDPVLPLPDREIKVTGEGDLDLTQRRALYCQTSQISLNEDFLTPENFRAVFRCANYDNSLEDLRPLLTSQQFTPFLKNMNVILKSKNTQDLGETLRSWLAEGPDGTSRADRLLPLLKSIIRNQSFQNGLPLLSTLLDNGNGVWDELLPNLADVLYQERFPDNYDDIFTLLGGKIGQGAKSNEYAQTAKQWAEFIKKEVDGQTVAYRALVLADQLREIRLNNTSIQEYLDQMNEKGAFVSLYLESGAVRGEEVDPRLNADAEEGEELSGNLPPAEQRRRAAYRKLWAKGPNGETAPIVQLVGLIDTFHRDRPEFLPALAQWFARNGQRLTGGITDYVLRAQIQGGFEEFKMGAYLEEFAEENDYDTTDTVDGEEFAEFLRKAFAAPKFATWLDAKLLEINRDQLGRNNAKIMATSSLRPALVELHTQPAVAEYGESLLTRATVLGTAIRRFSNTHRQKLKLEFRGKEESLEQHMISTWIIAANESLGESVVIDFGLRLVKTFFNQMANDFANKKLTLAEWYYQSPYSNPGTSEMIVALAVKELGLMAKYTEHAPYLAGELAREIFPNNESDRAAFSLLVRQVPNIYLYIKSGMSRSGNDLTRALSSKDRGYLIKNYVAALASAYQTGWIERGALLMDAYLTAFPGSMDSEPASEDLEDRRQVSLGADALKRVFRSLFRPEVRGKYETSTLGRLLVPASSLVSEGRRQVTERFLLTAAQDVIDTPDEKINGFFQDFRREGAPDDATLQKRRETLRGIADVLRDGRLPTVVRQVNGFFQEEAVKPAIKYLNEVLENGKLERALLLVRRVLGFSRS